MLLFGDAAVPVVIAFVYSIYELWERGVAVEYWLQTYCPLCGSVLSLVGLFAFTSGIIGRPRQPWRFFGAVGGMLGYIFALYLFGVLGIYRLYTLHETFSVLKLIAGIAWVLLGYRLLYKVWVLSELGVANK
jgi:hypothetical protein